MPKYKDVSGQIVEYCAINATEWGIRQMFGQSREQCYHSHYQTAENHKAYA